LVKAVQNKNAIIKIKKRDERSARQSIR